MQRLCQSHREGKDIENTSDGGIGEACLVPERVSEWNGVYVLEKTVSSPTNMKSVSANRVGVYKKVAGVLGSFCKRLKAKGLGSLPGPDKNLSICKKL